MSAESKKRCTYVNESTTIVLTGAEVPDHTKNILTISGICGRCSLPRNTFLDHAQLVKVLEGIIASAQAKGLTFTIQTPDRTKQPDSYTPLCTCG